jgi:hypothetical protein
MTAAEDARVAGEDVYLAWAPEGGRWSPWVKPLLFAHVDEVAGDEGPLPGRVALPPQWHREVVAPGTALVVELSGAEAVAAGVAAAELGFAPIPLFNARPGPPGGRSFPFPFDGLLAPQARDPEHPGRSLPIPIAAVDVRTTVRALVALAPRLQGGGVRGRGLPRDAAPAFLVDAHRHHSRGPLLTGRFDNRSAHGAADLPSAQRMREGGIGRVVVILRQRRPGWDLLATLSQWRAAGISLSLARLDRDAAPQPWPGFRAGWLLPPLVWLRRLALHGSGRRGFGGWVSPAVG